MASNILAGDQLNFTRMGIASVDEIKVVLADILRCEIKPQHLPKSITSCSELTTGRHKLRPEQQRLCCPYHPAVPDYNKFDVSLLYTLIRNLCPQLKPTQGWGKTPSITDLQVGDDIERLREFRNEMFAHLDSSGVEDVVFTAKWRDLEQIFQRMQNFLNTKGISVDYSKKLAIIAKSDFGFEDMEKYKIILEGILHILKENGNNGGPSITIHGNDEVFFGEKTCFQAILDQCSPSNNWPITWKKIQGNITEQLDTSRQKYRGSSSRCLVITEVSKEDEGEYRAVISRENNGTHMEIPSNSKQLTVIGEIPTITMPQEVNVPFGSTAVLQPMIQACPEMEAVEGQKSRRMDPNAEEFEIIDVTSPKYSRSTLDPKHPKLIINETTFDDNLFFRLVVVNKVGKSSSCTFLHVTGSPPNVFMIHDTDFQNQSVTLICKVLSDSSHPLTGIMWTKDNNKINISCGEGKYTGGDPDNPSLEIKRVNASDAGIYQCCASNIVGTTQSEKVTLALPNVKLLIKEKDVENGVFILQASIKSIPDAFKVQWKTQKTPHDEFQPINLHEETYKGTTISLPSPLLIVKNFNNSKHSETYSVEVTNFIGIKVVTSQEVLEEKQSIDENLPCLNDPLRKFYKKRGSSVRFFKLSKSVVNAFSDKVANLKQILLGLGDIEAESIKAAKSSEECIELIKENNLFNTRDVIYIQYLLKEAGCNEVYKKCVEYAKNEKALCFYETLGENGFIQVKFHICGNLIDYDDEEIECIKQTVADILECRADEIKIAGLCDSKSFILILSIKEKYSKDLTALNQHQCEKLKNLNVDYIIVGDRKIDIESQKSNYDLGLQKNNVAELNFNEVERFLSGPCTNLFREILRKYVQEEYFVTIIQKSKDQLLPLLTIDQQRMLYPVKGSFSGSYRNLDLPLLYILFQNVCFMEPHSKGWGKTPDPSDTSMAACIENIMEIYRKYFLNTPLCLEWSDFDKMAEAITNLKVKSVEKEIERKAKEQMEKRANEEMEGIPKEERDIFRKGMEIRVKDEMDIFKEKLSQKNKEGRDIFKIGLERGTKEKTEIFKKVMKRSTQEERDIIGKGMEIEDEIKTKERMSTFEKLMGKSAKEDTDFFKKGMEGRVKGNMVLPGKFRDLSISQHLVPSVVCTSSITVPGVLRVTHISCATPYRLWISDRRRLLQVDNTGHVIQKLKIVRSYPPTGAHSVTQDGDLIFVNGDKVQKMTLGGTITTLLKERESLICIHSSRINGDILVGYTHGVFRCDWRGNHRKELEVGFYYPSFITENKNGDILVSDRDRGAVVVMDKSGQHRFTYRGLYRYHFYPCGICTDILGQVVVCDSFNDSVHLLDQEGQFLRLLLTREHRLDCPVAPCVDDKHNLYVGQEYSNTIRVYKYLQETVDSKSSIVESKEALCNLHFN